MIRDQNTKIIMSRDKPHFLQELINQQMQHSDASDNQLQHCWSLVAIDPAS